MGVGSQRHAPAALFPGKTRYPLYRRLGRLQGRSGRVRKISPLPRFDLQNVQPVASRYTDCAIPARQMPTCTQPKAVKEFVSNKRTTHKEETALPRGACRGQQPIRLNSIEGSLHGKAIHAARTCF
jgi:hypothetical protein